MAHASQARRSKRGKYRRFLRAEAIVAFLPKALRPSSGSLGVPERRLNVRGLIRRLFVLIEDDRSNSSEVKDLYGVIGWGFRYNLLSHGGLAVTLRFDGFTLDPETGELRKDGELVKLKPPAGRRCWRARGQPSGQPRHAGRDPEGALTGVTVWPQDDEGLERLCRYLFR